MSILRSVCVFFAVLAAPAAFASNTILLVCPIETTVGGYTDGKTWATYQNARQATPMAFGLDRNLTPQMFNWPEGASGWQIFGKKGVPNLKLVSNEDRLLVFVNANREENISVHWVLDLEAKTLKTTTITLNRADPWVGATYTRCHGA